MASFELSDFCATQNVTYAHRVFDPDANNWCPVPGGGADALLFAGLAVFSSCALYSKLSAIWVLLAGAVFQLLATTYNLNHFGNALTIWLGMHPSTIFFEIFLPPLLLDSAVRTDFFLFRKVAAHCLIFAFVNVVVSTLAFIPLMLYGLKLAGAGWRAVDAALFGAMLGSTDAVAVTAILKSGGAPEMLSVLLEGESLFNDASSIVLFEIFLHMSLKAGDAASGRLSSELLRIAKLIGYLAATGAIAGVVMGVLTRLLFKYLHKRHVPPPVEVAVSLAGAYSVYLCTEYYIQGSGVIAVVVYGLYGASSYLWHFSSKGLRQGAYFKFWDVVSFAINGMVFFYVGCSIMHFFLSLSGEIFESGSAAIFVTLKTLPGILLAMFGLRWALITLEAPVLGLVGHGLTWQEVLFSTLGGLRGGLALILAQTVIANQGQVTHPGLKVVHAEMVIWLSAVVLFTLTVNASLLGPLMTVLGLNKVTPAQKHMHRRAHEALARFTHQTIQELQSDDDEMLKGVDWTAVVSGATFCSKAAKDLLESTENKPPHPKLHHDSAHRPAPSTHQPYKPRSSDTPRDSLEQPQQPQQQQRQRQRRRDIHQGAMDRSRADAASPSSPKGVNVPLLGRQYSGRGVERYTSADESDSEAGDIEAGTAGRMDAPPFLPESNSEALFIANRLQAQDQQLAQHAEQAEAPFLADSDTASESAASSRVSGSGSSSVGVGDLGSEGADQAVDEADLADLETLDAAEQQQQQAGEQDVQLSELTMDTKPKFKLLQPLITLNIADVLNSKRRASNLASGSGATTSKAAPERTGLPAAAAAAQPRRISPFANPTRSFISAAITAATADRTNGSSSPKGGSSVGRFLARRSSSLGAAANSFSRKGSLRESSMGVMTSIWQRQRQQKQQPGLSRLAAGSTGGAVDESAATGADGLDMFREFDTLSVGSSIDGESMTEEQFLEECRVSLLAGFKRHIRFKSAEGLLSKMSLRMLDYACNACLSRPAQPIDLWCTVRRDIKRRGLVKVLGAAHLNIRKMHTSLLRTTEKGRAVDQFLRWLLIPLLQKTGNFLRRRLDTVSLTVLEVALELWLALTASPQARMIRSSHSTTTGILQEELKHQACAVWQFITDRQIEAPDEFAALQTHRVLLAVARRQLAFVEQLSEVGAVEEAAAEALQELVERRLHRLESQGPNWSAPSLADIVRRQPFLADQGESMLLWLRAYGDLRSYTPGQCIVPRKRSGPPGIFIVLKGLVKSELVVGGTVEPHYVGVGGSLGFISGVLGKEVNGISLRAAYAQGDALGRGPLLLHLPMSLIQTIKHRAQPALQKPNQPPNTTPSNINATAAMSDIKSAAQTGASGGVTSSPVGGSSSVNAEVFAQLLLDMHRQAGIMILHRVQDTLVQELASHIEKAVQAIFVYTAKLPAAKGHAKLQRLLEAALGSTSSSITSGTAFKQGSAAGSDYASSLDGEAVGDEEVAHRLVMERAAVAAAATRDALCSANLVTLSPGRKYSQTSSMLLLKGSLRQSCIDTTAASSSSSKSFATLGLGSSLHPARGRSTVLQQFQAPALLAWAPELFGALQDRYDSSAQAYTAGPHGALLLVVPSNSSVPSAADESAKPTENAAFASDDVDVVQVLQQQLRLSSLIPLHRSTVPGYQQDQGDV